MIRTPPTNRHPVAPDLVSEVEAPAPLAADEPSSFVVEATRTQHVVYRGTDGAVHEIHWQ